MKNAQRNWHEFFISPSLSLSIYALVMRIIITLQSQDNSQQR